MGTKIRLNREKKDNTRLTSVEIDGASVLVGTFQKEIIELMSKNRREWTVPEIVEAIYGEPKHYRSAEYVKVHRALRALKKRNILDVKQVPDKWSLTFFG